MRNRLFRQVISVLLLFSLIVTMLPQNIFAERNEFSDVDSYKDEIYTLVDLGIIHGFTDNTFRPQTTITRGQGIAMIIREMGVSTENRKDPGFKDIKEGSRFYKEIATAKELGIVDGKVDGTFGVNEEMTRAQMAKILVSAYDLKLIESNNKSFKDVPTSHWSHPYISILVSNGITVGYHDGTFKPQAKLTRLHFSLFLYRYIHEVKEQTAQPGEVITNGENKTVLLEDTILIDEDLESSIDIEAKDENEYEITFSESVDIEKGDVFVLPATDEFPGGLAVKAEKITEKNNQVIIETSEPALDEVIYSINGTSEVELSPEYFTPAPGVVVEEVANVQPYASGEFIPIVLNLDNLYKGERINIGGSLEFGGTWNLDVDWGEHFDANLNLKQKMGVKVATTGVFDDDPFKVRVGDLKLPTSIPLVIADLDMYLVFDTNANVSVEVSGTLTECVGIKWDKKNGVSIYPEDKLDGQLGISSLDFNGFVQAGGEYPLNIKFAGLKMAMVGAGAGWQGDATIGLWGANGMYHFYELSHSIYLELLAELPFINWSLSDAEGSLTAYFDLGSKLFGNYVRSISVNPSTVKLAPKERKQLIVTGYGEDGSSDDITREKITKYESSDPSVVEVSDEGVVIATANAQEGDRATITIEFEQNGGDLHRKTVEVVIAGQLERGTLSGKVVDSVTSEPINEATISISNGNRVVKELKTTEDGSYEVSLSPANYKITVEKQDYKTVTSNVEITEANTVVHDVKLELIENQLPDNDESDSEQGDGFNQGAGYEQGAYDKLAIHPTRINWSGQSRFIGPENPRNVKTLFSTGPGDSNLDYVIGADGTIYYSKYYRSGLYAVGSDGVQKWKLDIMPSRLVIGENGIIYAADYTTLYAIDPSGKIEWECKASSTEYGLDILLGEDGSIYLYNGYKTFYKITPNGEVQWTKRVDASSYSGAPLLAKDGNIYIASNHYFGSIQLYKINSDTGESNEIYKYKPGPYTNMSVYDFQVGADGTFYITNNYKNSGSQVGELLAIRPNGEMKWRLSGSEELGGISISKDGTIYVNAAGRSTEIDSETTGVLYAVNSNGEIEWEREGGGSVGFSIYANRPVIGADGTIYNIGDNHGATACYAFNPEDGSEKWQLPTLNNSVQLFLGGNGLLYTTEYKNNVQYLSVIKDAE